MGIINGLSHKAIKYFRDEPAALAVYWIYCSRVNNEGVAWPSIRGLAESTGWSKQTVTNARKWLVERGALEPVADYTRPQWRNLPPAEQNKKKGLNRSEYYRVTGVICIDGTRYDLLYIPGHTPASELEVPDVLPGRTPTAQDAYAIGRLPDRTELSISSELNTSPELDTTTTSGVVVDFPATQKERERARVFRAYEENIGLLTPMLADKIKDALDLFSADWIIEAIGIAVQQERRAWSYVEGVLKNWKRNGKRDPRRASRPAAQGEFLSAEQLAEMAPAPDEYVGALEGER